jgi:hypothetical protein
MGDNLRKVQSGQQLKIPAEAYNAFIDAARAEKASRHNIALASSPDFPSSTIIKVRNQTGVAQNRFNVLAIEAPIVAPAANLQQFKNAVAFNGVVPLNPMTGKRFAVLAEPLAAGAVGRAVLYGATPVSIGISGENHQFANPINGLTSFMVSTASNGQFRILWKEPGLGIKWGIVAAEPSAATPAIVFQLVTALGPGIAQLATGQIVISSNSTDYPAGTSVTIYNTGLSRGTIGARGLAMLHNSVWWVYELDQPAIAARFLFTGATHSAGGENTFGDVASQIPIAYSNFTALTRYPFGLVPSVAIANPSNLIAFTGDSGLCMWDAATEQWILTEVYPAQIRRFYFRLTGDWPAGLDQTFSQAACMHADATNHGGDLVAGSITVKDRWNLASNSKVGDVGLCQLNYKTGQFDILEISHVFTVGRGRVSQSFSGSPSTFTVKDVEGFNGRAPVGSLLTVENELQIDAASEDDPLELRWNPLTSKFYALPRSGGGGRVFPVTLYQIGGSQGTATAPASWTYDVLNYDTGELILSAVDPVAPPHRWRRPSVGQMLQANFGYAHYLNDGSEWPVLVLGWINEVAEQQACQTQADAPLADFPTLQSPAINSQNPIIEEN